MGNVQGIWGIEGINGVDIGGGGVPLLLSVVTFTPSLLIFLAESPGGAADQIQDRTSTKGATLSENYSINGFLWVLWKVNFPFC